MKKGTYPQNTLGSNQLDQFIGHGSLRIALGIRLEISEITGMAFAVRGSTVSFGVRVD